MRTSIKVEGLKELDEALKELPKATGKNVMRRVARNALGMVIAAARPLVPVDDGQLRKSLAVSTKLSKRQATLARRDEAEGKASITVYAGASALPHAHLIEFGTKERVQKTTGRRTGRVKAKPFMRPAWDAKKGAVLDSFKSDMWTEIQKAAKRLAAKQARELAKAAKGV
jgi:HK97 gp10 family phage protein